MNLGQEQHPVDVESGVVVAWSEQYSVGICWRENDLLNIGRGIWKIGSSLALSSPSQYQNRQCDNDQTVLNRLCFVN